MFTVLICSETIIRDCQKTYSAFLKPLLEQPDWSFCEWNPDGDTLDEAVPALRSIVAKHKDWRAVIVNDRTLCGMEGIEKMNPFNVAGSVSSKEYFEKIDAIAKTAEEEERDEAEVNAAIKEVILDFREQKEKAFAKAVENPITKLTTWLLGAADSSRHSFKFKENDEPEEYEGEDTLLYEIDRYHARCYAIMHEHFVDEPQIFHVPSEVILVAERRLKEDTSITANGNHMEFDYSRFYEDNMYHRTLRYILYDMIYMVGRRDADVYFTFLVFLLTYVSVEHPGDTLKPERVYQTEAILDTKRISEMCHRYIFKLLETRNRIDIYSQRLDAQKKMTIDNATAERLFEKEVIIPVTIKNDFNTKTLMSKHDQIGIAKDCPGDEQEYWREQYKGIRRVFSKFLRSPKRSIKTAIDTEFRKKNYIDDNRVLRLNETQKDDIRYKLLEEEERMVKISASPINNEDEYVERIEKADKKIRDNMRLRLTRRASILVGLIGTIAFALGFLPWIIDNIKMHAAGTAQMISIVAFIAGVALCLILSFLKLVGFRAKLVSLFREFNIVMDGVIASVSADLDSVSEYLSHACNVMREFSVLNAIDSDTMKKRRTLYMHTHEINKNIDSIYDKFFKYIDEDLIEEHAKTIGHGEAYEFDFTDEEPQEYEIPYAADTKEIEFMQPGYVIEVPIDYLKEVTLRREEMYDE